MLFSTCLEILVQPKFLLKKINAIQRMMPNSEQLRSAKPHRVSVRWYFSQMQHKHSFRNEKILTFKSFENV